MDTLLKALECRGFEVEVTEPDPRDQGQYPRHRKRSPSRTSVHILGSFVEFGIEEGADIVPVAQKGTGPRSKAYDSSDYSSRPDTMRVPNGKLALRIKTTLFGFPRKTWRDGKKQRIENCLNAFTLGLIHAAERMRLEKLEFDRRQELFRAEELRRLEEARNHELLMVKIHNLDTRVSDFVHAKNILEYINAMENSAEARGEDTSSKSEFGLWLAWARNHAKHLSERAIDTTLKAKPPR